MIRLTHTHTQNPSVYKSNNTFILGNFESTLKRLEDKEYF